MFRDTHQSQLTHLQYFLSDLQLFGQKFTVVQSVLDKFDLDTRHVHAFVLRNDGTFCMKLNAKRGANLVFLPLICFRVHFMELA